MKIRIISAVVAILIAIFPIYFGGILYNFAVGILALLAFNEILYLKKSHKKIPRVMMVVALFAFLFLLYGNFNGNIMQYGLTYQRIILPCLLLLAPTVFYKNDKYTTKDAFYLIGTVLFLGLAFNSFIIVRSKGLNLFMYLVLIPVFTDTFAYFIGLLIGKHKMAPEVSPKKTWEGFTAGLIFGSLIPCAFYHIFVDSINIKIILLTIILSMIGQIGDLIFSKIKRENDIKDFSNLMPGHGGALDRLDSSIVIFMTFVLLSTILY